jgi:Tol biopolymer transport system component
MGDTKEMLERARRQFPPPGGVMDALVRRRDRKRRNRRIFSASVAIVAVAAVALALSQAFVWGRSTPVAPSPAPSLPPVRHGDEVLRVVADTLQAIDPVTGASRTLVECEDPADHGGIDQCMGPAAWSPDGVRVAFTLNCSFGSPPSGDGAPLCDQRSGIWLLDWLGDRRQLTSFFGLDPHSLGGFAWSPDGSRIAFARPGNEGGLYVANADGTGPALLPGTAAAGSSTPVWSPDGSRIAYAADGHVDVASASDGDPIVVGDGTQPAWSRDGTHLAFVGSDGIEVVNGDGAASTTVGDGYEFAWSADGSRLVYHIEKPLGGGRFQEELRTVAPDGSNPVTVLRSSCCAGIVDGGIGWSPDGTRIYFLDGTDETTWRETNADGTSADVPIEQLERVDELLALSWRPCLCTDFGAPSPRLAGP